MMLFSVFWIIITINSNFSHCIFKLCIFKCECLLLLFSPENQLRFRSFINFAVVTTVPIYIGSSAVLRAGEFFNPMLCPCIQLSHGCGNQNSIVTLWDFKI